MAKSNDLDDLYTEIQTRKTPVHASSLRSIQPDNLRPLLRDYQKAAVRWMLEKEGVWENRRGDEDGHFGDFFVSSGWTDGCAGAVGFLGILRGGGCVV